MKILLSGHSFVRRLGQFVDNYHYPDNFELEGCQAEILGYGGLKVGSYIKKFSSKIHSFQPQVVIVDIGTNDLGQVRPETVGSQIEELATWLHREKGVEQVIVGEVCQRFKVRGDLAEFNKHVDLLNNYLSVVIGDLEYARFWVHKGLQQGMYFLEDGVHLNEAGNKKLWRSWRGAVIQAKKGP